MSEQTPRARALGRRRRANEAGGRQAAHRVRVSAEEELKLQLLADAQGVTVVRLMVEAALATGESPLTATEKRAAIAELFKANRLLANIASNVNQIARVANATGEVAAEAPAVFAAAKRTALRLDDIAEELGKS